EHLAFDKTGTLTKGRITVQVVSDGARTDDIRRLSARTRAVLDAAWRATPVGDDGEELPHATDQAVIDGATVAGLGTDGQQARWELIEDLPFESARAFHAAVGRTESGLELVVKGAPEIVLPRCASWAAPDGNTTLDDTATGRLLDDVERLARRGLRVLAVARRPAPRLMARLTTGDDTGPTRTHQRQGSGDQLDDTDIDHLELLGFLGLADPVRPSAAWAVQTLRRAGVNVTMITGDHPSTAEAIAVELDILNGHRI